MTLVFNNCCFCINLRQGSLIIGYVNLIGLIWLFYLLTINLIHHTHNTTMVTMLGLNLVLVIIHFALTTMLLIAIHRGIHRFIYTFVVYNAIVLAIDTFFFIINCFMFSYMAVDIITEVFSILLTAYFLLVIRSYWLKLKSEDQSATPNNQSSGQVVYLAPGPHSGSGITGVQRPYPPGTYAVQIQGAYPVPGAYPVQGPYPVQETYPAQQNYPGPHSYPVPPGAYQGSGAGTFATAPVYNEQTEKTMVY